MKRESPESFLESFHRLEPGATPRALDRGRLGDGRSSYEYLASLIPPETSRARVLDLACGDGHLLDAIRARVAELDYTGVDLTSSEIERARDLHAGPGVSFSCERAQSLSLEPRSVDVVLCHMAFMLLEDIEGAVRELARVLAPGGVFGAIIGGHSATAGAFDVFVRLCREARERGELDGLRLGDDRARQEAGLRELLSPAAGFQEPVIIEDESLVLDGGIDEVWSSLALTYDVGYLSADEKRAFERAFREQAGRLADDDGVVPSQLGVRRITARRAT